MASVVTAGTVGSALDCARNWDRRAACLALSWRRCCSSDLVQASYRGDDQFPRSHAIYLARAADAYLTMHDLDAAVEQVISD